MVTRISASSLKRFFIADANAFSSAPKTTARVTFFSRARASTNRRISRLIAVYPENQEWDPIWHDQRHRRQSSVPGLRLTWTRVQDQTPVPQTYRWRHRQREAALHIPCGYRRPRAA